MTEQASFTTDQIVKKYIELRDAIDRISAETKAKIEPLQAALEALSSYGLNMLNESGETSKKTEFGTMFVKESTFVGVADWDESLKFIRANEAWNMLNHAINKTAVQEHMKANAGVPPPGVSVTTKKEVQFRRPVK